MGSAAQPSGRTRHTGANVGQNPPYVASSAHPVGPDGGICPDGGGTLGATLRRAARAQPPVDDPGASQGATGRLVSWGIQH